MLRLPLGLALAITLVVGGDGTAGTVEGSVPVAPYTDSRYLLSPGTLSAYAQPWRGYLETRPATALAAGVGMNYNLPPDADHDAVVGLLASVGVRHLRMEVPFSAIETDGRLKSTEAYVLDAFLRASRTHGIRPLLLLNAHAGAPGPYTTTHRRLRLPAAKGARTILLEDARGLVPGRSGLSNLTEYRMAEVLFTSVDPVTGVAVLSRPLPVDLPAGDRELHTLRYAPLHPVGTPQFEDSAGGWVAYASTVLDAVAATGVVDFDVEIWNELSHARWWLQVNDYYDPPLHNVVLPDFLNPGGTAWEIARRTTALVERRAPRARVVWGFSNTTFLHTPSSSMPPGTDGESYHPYGAGLEHYPTGLDASARWEHGHVPTVRKVMPEGWAHLGTRHEQLPRHRLAPGARGTNYLHFLTEHGMSAREAGVWSEPEAQALKAAAALRSLGFWLNKGIDVVDLFSAHDPDPAGMGMLRSDVAPRDYGRLPREQLLTPQLRALAGFTAPLAGASVAAPAQLTVAAESYGPQPEVFPAGPGHPSLPYRDMLALLPYQVTPSKFVVGSYVMSWDITRPPPPMSFRVTLGSLPFPRARVSLLDPVTGASTPVATTQRADGEVTADVRLDDRFRWLVVEAATAVTPRPALLRARPRPVSSWYARLPGRGCEGAPVVTARWRLAARCRV